MPVNGQFYYRLRRPLNIQSQIILQMYRALAVAVADWQYACPSHEAASTRMPPGVYTRPLDVLLPFLYAPRCRALYSWLWAYPGRAPRKGLRTNLAHNGTC